MSEIVVDIDFGEGGNGGDYVLDGWGEPEGAHCWAVGPESRLRLPIGDRDGDYVVALRAKPWLSEPEIARQTIMLGLNGRLVTTFAMTQDGALAFAVPSSMRVPGTDILSFTSLESARSQKIDAYRDGRSMNLMMRTLRVFRHPAMAPVPLEHFPPIAGDYGDGTLKAAIEAIAEVPLAKILGRFESLGQWCRLAKILEEGGANHLGLLRYAGLHQPDLFEGLVKRFAGVGAARNLVGLQSPALAGEWDVHESLYRVWWHTFQKTADVPEDQLLRGERLRLSFLQRKFANVLSSASRIFVMPVEILPPEVLAIFVALNLWGPNKLLFVEHSGSQPPGTVQRVGPGLLVGHLDRCADDRGSDGVWLSVLANAYRLDAREYGR